MLSEDINELQHLRTLEELFYSVTNELEAAPKLRNDKLNPVFEKAQDAVSAAVEEFWIARRNLETRIIEEYGQ